MPITLTATAAEKVKEVLKENGLPESGGLRVGIKGGGCSGFEYVLDLAKEPSKFDIVSDTHGARVICDKKSYLFVNGSEIDFQKSLMATGFVVKNPAAKASCGCGTSFAV